jgi:hypothetical protein
MAAGGPDRVVIRPIFNLSAALSCAIALPATNAIAAVTPIARNNMFRVLPRQAADPASIVCRSTGRANVSVRRYKP